MTALPYLKQDVSGLSERHVLGMAEMGYRGLSEQWLKRRAGDLHWRLIARAMGQKEAVFTCCDGEPLLCGLLCDEPAAFSTETPQAGRRSDPLGRTVSRWKWTAGVTPSY